jgi:ATP-dependent Clp protease protease subunit
MTYKIYLYDTDTDCIGSGTLSSSHVQSQLEAAAGADVEVHISSVGGSAFDAIAIYDLLKKYDGTVTTYVDALAASAASIVAMGGKSVVMSKYALLMIHKPMVGTGGNADELLKDVQMLNTVQSRLAQIYMDKTGLDGVTINSLINAVTWLSADQALDLGFIDQVEVYNTAITNTAIIKNYVSAAPVFYQRYINKILRASLKTLYFFVKA